MNSRLRISVILAALMTAASIFAYSTKPTILLADVSSRRALADEVPVEFKRWKKLTTDVVVADPTQLAVLKYLYSETLSATYGDRAGRSVMLSIAYGKDQSDGHDVHKPDQCYPAQGFTVLEQRDIPLKLDAGRTITVRYMKTQNGERVEPLFFWTTAGDYLYRNKLEKKLIGIKYSAANLIPDGMILRVSTLEKDSEIARNSLVDFVKDWYESLPEQQRKRFFGTSQQ